MGTPEWVLNQYLSCDGAMFYVSFFINNFPGAKAHLFHSLAVISVFHVHAQSPHRCVLLVELLKADEESVVWGWVSSEHFSIVVHSGSLM